MVKKIVLFGAGGCGREVAEIIVWLNRIKPTYELLGFLDESNCKLGRMINGYPVLGNDKWLLKHPQILCTCTIADVNVRARIQERLIEQGTILETIVSGDVAIPQSSAIGKGCVIYPDVKISVNTEIADGVFLNTGVHLGHDVSIGKYTNIMPGTGISGGCKIGEKVSVGGHAYIIPERRIGDKAVIAAGSVVFSNVKAGTTVLGNPAKRIKALED